LSCSVSGSWVVVFSGTLDSGVRANTDRSWLERSVTGGDIVIARLLAAGAGLGDRAGLMGWA